LSVSTTNREQIELYPNPAKNILYLKNNNQSKKSKMYFYNFKGILVKQESITSSTDMIKIDDLFTGLYIVRFQEENRNIKELKLVIE
jgi:hypothetical protein